MAIFGNRESRLSHWLKTGLTQARCVGRLDVDQNALASGFLVNGALFNDALADVPLFLTCQYVIDDGKKKGRFSASVLFEGMFEDASPRVTATCQQVLIDSPIKELNYAVLLLDRWPGAVGDLVVAPARPELHTKVFVVSYPRGKGLTISLDDNEVVRGHPSRVPVGLPGSHVYYRAPTEPGSAGAPVFNENWEIVAIHAGGFRDYEFNWGIAFDAIVADARRRLADKPLPRKVLVRARAAAKHESNAQAEPNAEYFSVFISYSHADSVFANRLYHALHARGIRAWLDVKQMLPGDDIYEEVQKGIQLWDKVLLCASKESLTSWWVDSEIDRIFQKERELFKKKNGKVLALVPLMLDDFLLSKWNSGKAQEVKSRIAADFRGWQDQTRFEETLERLVLALRSDGKAKEPPPASKL